MAPLRVETSTPNSGPRAVAERVGGLIVPLGCLLVMLALRWHPIWTIGFYQDDSVSSSWLYEARASGHTILGTCWEFLRAMLRFQGRFTPIYNFVIQPGLMLVSERLWLYRLLQAACHLATLAAFMVWVKRSGADWRYVVLCVGVLASMYEIRDYHDAAFSQAATLPLTALFGFLALERGEAVRDRGCHRRWRYTIASSALCLAAVLTHEFGFAFAVASGWTVFAVLGMGGNATRCATAVLLPSLTVIVVGLALKTASVNSGTAYGSFAIGPVAVTFLKQLVATLPLSYAV